MYNKLEITKAFYEAGMISKEDYIATLWEIGMLTWDEAIDQILRTNSNKRRGNN